jgi:hypothetical protein
MVQHNSKMRRVQPPKRRKIRALRAILDVIREISSVVPTNGIALVIAKFGVCFMSARIQACGVHRAVFVRQ